MLVRVRWQTDGVPERDLLVLSEEPLNAETKLDERTPAITPAGKHYVRTHFPVPTGPRSIVIDGAGTGPPAISLDQIRSLPTRSMVVTLECAGNGRRFLDPKVPGEQWGLGAVGTATWTGASLRDVLRNVRIPTKTVELLFRGADEGVPKDLGQRIGYERSLPIGVALRDDVLVAYLMEGKPIPPEHGGPLRLIVPGWYGMASVKWLARIALLDAPFTGFFQKDRYVIGDRQLGEIAPRAILTYPQDGATVERALWVIGYAWSGAAPVVRVDLSRDGGEEWAAMPSSFLQAGPSPYAWTKFSNHMLLLPGFDEEWSLVVRAVDAAGSTQPLTPMWNPLGYANNAAQPTRIRVRS
jgi:DMSO/TMAO reductase YedYZ molybdopterin-dependent catalytic subunit